MKTEFDVVIVGAGMIGAAVALGLAQQGREIGLLEAQAPASFAPEQPVDLRLSAINVASERLLSELGVWPAVLSMRATPYQQLATWEREGHEVHFDSAALQLPHLGHIVENRVLQLALWQALQQLPNVHWLSAGKPLQIQQTSTQVQLIVAQQRYSAALLLGCDGAQSQVRQQVHIGLTGWQYRHHCLVMNVATALPQQAITWQRFYPSGPRAMLPLPGAQASLVWYDSPERIAALMQLSLAQLSAEAMHNFPARLGEIEVMERASFPLVRQHAQRYFQGRVGLLGDAAHTINPLAGQGVNLGFKDVAAFLALCAGASNEALAQQGGHTIFARYEQQRRGDNLRMQSAMDLFYMLFSHSRWPVSALRNLGLYAAERSGPIKTQLMRHAIGLL